MYVFWGTCVRGKGQVGPCSALRTHPPPGACIPAPHWLPIPAQRQCSTPQEPLIQLLRGQIEIPPGGRGPEGQGVFKAEHKTSTYLDPTSSWNFYELRTAGTQQLVYVSFSISFLSSPPSSSNSSSWNF